MSGDERPVAAAPRVRDDDRDRAADHRDDEAQQDRPDPIAGIPPEALSPTPCEPTDEPAAGVEPKAAVEAVLLPFGEGRAAARAEALVATVHR